MLFLRILDPCSVVLQNESSLTRFLDLITLFQSPPDGWCAVFTLLLPTLFIGSLFIKTCCTCCPI